MLPLLLAEINTMPAAVLAAIHEQLHDEKVRPFESHFVTPTGSVKLRQDIETQIEHTLTPLNESTLRDIMTLEPYFIVTVTDIVPDIDEGEPAPSLPDALYFVYPVDTDTDTDEMIDTILSDIDDKISDATGYCFSSCKMSIDHYLPYEGTIPLTLP